MTERHSLYREIHKGLRALLADLVERAGTTDFRDAASLATLKEAVHDGFQLLESHAHHEDTFIGPELERRLPELARRIGQAHASHEPEIESLVALMDAIEPSRPDAPARGHLFVVALSKFAAELNLHMAEEEEIVMPALWSVATDEELQEIEHRLIASIPPDKMTRYLRWMIPAMNTPERVGMLGSMKSGAPAEVFAGVRELARSVLSPADDAALSSGLASVA